MYQSVPASTQIKIKLALLCVRERLQGDIREEVQECLDLMGDTEVQGWSGSDAVVLDSCTILMIGSEADLRNNLLMKMLYEKSISFTIHH